MAQNAFILILSSDKTQGERLRDLLREEYGHACLVVYKLEEALDSIRARTPDVVITPTILHGAQAARPLAELLESLAPDATLLTVGDGDRAPPAKRIRVRVLPDDAGDVARLVAPIHEAAGKAVGRRDDRLLQQSIDRTEIEEFEGIVGTSPQIKRIIERIKKAARNKLTVLILGETGTGKDLIAHAIHRRSDRARKPFKSLNCAGLSESLIESELFGHVKGSFTGASADRKGYFAAADGGSLFLDEIGDMPLAMQAKLLRVLENREFTPVGTTEVRRVDVRLLAATNSDLNEKV